MNPYSQYHDPPESLSVLQWICVTVIIVCLLFSFWHYLNIPVVYWSTTKDECVRILINDKECDCMMLDELDRYKKVWVK